jgi:peptide/nickel transport system substrate-binding protein
MSNESNRNDLVHRSNLLARAINRRQFLGGIAAAGAATVMAGSIGKTLTASAQDSSPVAGGTLAVALTGQPDTLDPQKAGVYTSSQVTDNIFSKLVYVDAELNFIPGLASAWTAISDTEWEFTLIENAVFHNGEKFTSADVVYSFNRIKDPATASPAATVFAPVSAVTPDGDYKVKFTLEAPYGPFLAHLAGSGSIVNQKAVEAADPARNPVGTGPFKFVEWVADDHITLERWDQYYEANLPYLDGVVFRGMPVDDSRMTALESGEIQWVDAIPLQKVSDVQANEELNYYTAATAGLPDYVAFNCTAAPFDNLALRQAVSWAIDRNAILQLAYSGVGEVANEEVASGNAWATGLTTYSNAPDIDKAKQLLAESGFDTSQTLTYLGLPQYPELLRTGEIIQENLAAIGLKMEIEQQEVTVWSQNFFAHNYQLTSGYWSSILDPDQFYGQLMFSTSPSNVTGYNNPQMDTLATSARTETDFETRKAMYTQARELINAEVPLTFVHYELLNYATAKNVQGTVIYPSMELRFKDVWIAD